MGFLRTLLYLALIFSFGPGISSDVSGQCSSGDNYYPSARSYGGGFYSGYYSQPRLTTGRVYSSSYNRPGSNRSASQFAKRLPKPDFSKQRVAGSQAGNNESYSSTPIYSNSQIINSQPVNPIYTPQNFSTFQNFSAPRCANGNCRFR